MCYVLPVIVHYKLLRHRQVQTQKWQRLKEQQVQVGALLGLVSKLLLLLHIVHATNACGRYACFFLCHVC